MADIIKFTSRKNISKTRLQKVYDQAKKLIDEELGYDDIHGLVVFPFFADGSYTLLADDVTPQQLALIASTCISEFSFSVLADDDELLTDNETQK